MSGGRQQRRGISFWLGIGLVMAGVAMLGYVGWQLWGTNFVAERRQRDAVEALEKTWRETLPPGTDTVGETDTETETDTGTDTGTDKGDDGRAAAEPAAVTLGTATALIRIPRFGDDYVMPVFEGVADDVLARGYGHFEEAAQAGEKGNYALAAHRVTHGEPLRDMPSLRPGDEVQVETRDRIYTYVLDTDPNALVVTFRDVWVVDEEPVNPRGGVGPADDPRLITLTTCSELFHTDNRMIAFGHLTSTEKKPGAAS